MATADVTTQDMAVGTFDTHDEAEAAVQQLIDAGIPADRISIVSRGFEARNKVTGVVTAGDVARAMAGTGAWTGGLFGLLAGSAFLWAPAVGPLVVLGPLVGTALGALQGGVVGGLMGAILGRGVENERILEYETDLQAGKLLVVVHGDPQQLETARRVMGENSGRDIETHSFIGAPREDAASQ